MQLSLDPQSELHSVTVTLKRDDRNETMAVVALAFNRDGTLLDSSAIVLDGWRESELIADLLREVALGWLWRDAKGAVVTPFDRYRKARNELHQRLKREG